MENTGIFIIDLLCTIMLFIISLLLTLGCKFIMIAIKEHFAPKKEQPPQPKAPSKPRPKKPPPAVRSIEINPNEIDRIYVKRDA